jgi:4-hydroxybenzoate polyprenyltransferase
MTHAGVAQPSLAAATILAARDIKLSHSIFALPFAVLGAVLALVYRTPGTGLHWGILLGLIVACMVSGRTWAMLINRLADAKFDRANPRTARRAVASGALPAKTGWGLAIASAVGFTATASLFGILGQNWWPLILSVPVLGWLALYSYTKRFTALCHVVLGVALAISPLAATVAIDPLSPAWGTVLKLSGFVMLWVAGFDVLYALQDEAFDRSTGLNSIPSALGKNRAVWVARLFHLGAWVMLGWCWLGEGRFGAITLAGVCIVGALLVLEHVILIRRGLAGLPMVFFTINGVVSLVFGTLGVIDSVAGL